MYFCPKSYKEAYCQIVRMGFIWFCGVIPSTSYLSALLTLRFGSFLWPHPVVLTFSNVLIYIYYSAEYQSKLAASSIRHTKWIYYWLQNSTQKDNPQGWDGNIGAQQPLVPIHRSVFTWCRVTRFWWIKCFKNKIYSHFQGTIFFLFCFLTGDIYWSEQE